MKKSGAESDTVRGEFALTIGTFDGVHLGHQSLLDTTKKIATDRCIESAAYTYEVPPKRHLGAPGPRLIMDPEKKLELLRSHVNRVIVGDFLNVKDYSPCRFVEDILVGQLNVDAVIVGKEWRFGRDRSGSYCDLEEMSDGRFSVHPQQQVLKRGRPVSSTWIRSAITNGKIGLATDLLGRYPSYSGRVVKGEKVGSDLGFPTANVKVDPRVALPKPGNYAGFVSLEGDRFKAAVHVGDRPTFGGSQDHQIEVYLMDFEGDLYDKFLEARIVKYLGRSKKYDKITELKKAIKSYVREAKRVLEEEKPARRQSKNRG